MLRDLEDKSVSTPVKSRASTPKKRRARRARVVGVAVRAKSPAGEASSDEAPYDLKALKLEEHVRRLLSEAPPLTEEQRSHIAALLRSGGGIR